MDVGAARSSDVSVPPYDEYGRPIIIHVRSQLLRKIPDMLSSIESALIDLGERLSNADDQFLSLTQETRWWLRYAFGSADQGANEAVPSLRRYFPGLPGLSRLCDWLSSEPDVVLNDLLLKRGTGIYGVPFVIDEDEETSLLGRKLATFLFRFVF